MTSIEEIPTRVPGGERSAGEPQAAPAVSPAVPAPSAIAPASGVRPVVVKWFPIHPLANFDFKSAFETEPRSAADKFLELLNDERACLERVEMYREMELVRNRNVTLGGYASRMLEEFLRELYWVANHQLLDAVALEIQEPQRNLEAGRRIARLANHPEALWLARCALFGGADVLEDLALQNSSRLDLWLHEQLESNRLQTLLAGDLPGVDLSGQWVAAWRRIPRSATPEAARANLAVAPSYDVACKTLAERWFLDNRVIVDIPLD